jgi:hypothetical protein
MLAFMIKRSSLPEIDTDKEEAGEVSTVEKKTYFSFLT